MTTIPKLSNQNITLQNNNEKQSGTDVATNTKLSEKTRLGKIQTPLQTQKAVDNNVTKEIVRKGKEIETQLWPWVKLKDSQRTK